jgi:hypothetical protein
MAPPVVRALSGLSQVVQSTTQERTRESVEYCRRTGGKLEGRLGLPDERRGLVRRLKEEGES